MRKRNELKKADAILSADWHMRPEAPEAWVGDYFKAQSDTLDFLSELQEDHDMCPIVAAGDIYDHWKVSHEFENWLMNNLPQGDIITVAGQHDLRHHRKETFSQTGLAVLHTSGSVHNLKEGSKVTKDKISYYGFPWKSDIKAQIRPSKKEPKHKVALAHISTYRGKEPYPGCDGPKASSVMNTMSDFDLIVTGDIHIPFVSKKDGRLLVNPGSLMRISADQVSYRPRVYLWYADTNEVLPVFIPQNKGDVSRSHVDAVDERDERVESFVKRLKKGGTISGLDYKKNIKRFTKKSQTKQTVVDIITEAISD